MAAKKKILLVEDHPIFRLGLGELINNEDDLEVCGGADNVNQALQVIADLQPDLVVADITLENSDGIDLVKEVSKRHRRLPVLMLSMHDEFLYAERALHAGARGYIMKQEAMESVVTAIRHVLGGKVYLNDAMKERILANIADRTTASDKAPLERLTDREMEVFSLIGLGFTTREIARKLRLSIKTIG
ncbi:MAG: response regulator transcription factor, partial [Desulfobacterales bacterium]|nr:response regulator transcription factor [Desulfobacterales bacterium]